MATFKRRTDNREENYLQGRAPYSGLLGRAGQVNPLDKFAADMQDRNPGYEEFQNDSQTFRDIAPLSQEKFNRAASTSMPAFRDDADNAHAINFLNNYQMSVQKGLISEDDRVGPDKIAFIATQPAMMGSNASNPNTAGTFPGASGVKI